MDVVDDFLAAPSDQVLDTLTKVQLRKVCDHYNLKLGLKKSARLAQIRRAVKTKLSDRKVLPSIDSMSELEPDDVSTPLAPLGALSNTGWTFEQQKEWLELQHKEREAERQLEYNKIKNDRDIALERLRLIAEGKIVDDGGGAVPTGPARTPDIAKMTRLIPRFNEKDPDVFFSLFESVADDCGWSDFERTLLLQSVLVGKGQEAFIAMSVADRKIYNNVKDAVLKVYELVPEAYRLRFRNWKKGDKQNYTEVARELKSHFNRWCAAVGVSTFDELCNLIVLEQFRNILPDRIAVYINERKVATAAEASVLSDEYVLTHKHNFREYNSGKGYREQRFGRFGERSGFSSTPSQYVDREQSRGKADPSVCHYCSEQGHWKNECPVLKERGQRRNPSMARPVALAVSGVRARPENIHTGMRPNPEVGVVSSNFSADSLVGASQYSVSDVIKADVNDYSPFITDGFVSLVGRSAKVPVKILRDTGASESFLLESVLPFSSDSTTGNVLVKGIGLQVVTVPLHRIELQSDLVQGEVVIAVCPSLPVDGVHLILGNNLAGGRVWRDVPSPGVVKRVTSIPSGADGSIQNLPEVSTACAEMHAMNSVFGAEVEEKHGTPVLKPVLPDLPSLTLDDFVVAQKEDATLDELFVCSAEEIHGAEKGNFVQDGLLVRRGMPQTKVFEDPVFQIVAPHGDIAGHLGVGKTYDRLVKHFFWPGLKKEVACFTKTCPTSQLTGMPKQVIEPAPLYPFPTLGNPFEHLQIECAENLTKTQKNMSWIDHWSEPRVFSPVDQVLALLPIAGSPFLSKYTGPNTVVRQVSDLSYLVSNPDRRRNMQLYYSRSPVSGAAETGDQVQSVSLAAVTGIFSFSPHMVAVCGDEDVVGPGDCMLQPQLRNSEELSDLGALADHLSKAKASEFQFLSVDFTALFSDTQSCTHLGELDIDVSDSAPRQRDEQGVDWCSCFRVCFFSKNCHNLTIEKEMLVLIWGLQHFNGCLSGGAVLFIIHSNYNPLTTSFSNVSALCAGRFHIAY
ncbi:uncharacterized protein LOC134070456 isoform X1 [Sardina pilchardus]|uniref:uncharacterized protein LOC134070456 isoform X1 n=1 Tax=Sardina pilchardus TaxID=27697 RepID=UPI002E15202A